MNNKAFQRMITDGVDVQYRRDDGSIKTDKVWIFDLENVNNNLDSASVCPVVFEMFERLKQIYRFKRRKRY
ncbi:MAG: hypothetical protein QME73_01215 [Bacillota bacterium]|nr:hypothetical protein [Bacillota bacterium]